MMVRFRMSGKPYTPLPGNMEALIVHYTRRVLAVAIGDVPGRKKEDYAPLRGALFDG